MLQIWTQLKDHLRIDFDWKVYGGSFAFTGMLLFLIYGFEVETMLVHLGPWEYLGSIWATFIIVYFGALWIKTGSAYFKQLDLVLRAAFYVSLIAVSSSLLFIEDWTASLKPWEAAYTKRILYNSVGSMITFITLTIYLLYHRNREEHFFGLFAKRPQLSPYIFLLIAMLPVIWLAAQQGHFLETYPVFKGSRYREVFGLSISQMTILFETVYLLDFIRVEVLFRGALIIGVSRFLGRHSVLPMAVLYCILHLNKPMGEAISSFFGGYLLGVIALYQRHILGGTILHVGIAAMMEAFAYYYST